MANTISLTLDINSKSLYCDNSELETKLLSCYKSKFGMKNSWNFTWKTLFWMYLVHRSDLTWVNLKWNLSLISKSYVVCCSRVEWKYRKLSITTINLRGWLILLHGQHCTMITIDVVVEVTCSNPLFGSNQWPHARPLYLIYNHCIHLTLKFTI